MKDVLYLLPSLQEKGETGVLCLLTATTGSTPRKAGARMLVIAGGGTHGTVGGGRLEYLVTNDARSLTAGSRPHTRRYNLAEEPGMQSDGTAEVYFEVFTGGPLLYIFGGGHIGRSLAGLAPALGFRTQVIDPRPEIANGWDADQGILLQTPFEEAVYIPCYGPDTYLLITSPSHETDELLLVNLLPREFAYLGMVAGRQKVAEITRHAIKNHGLNPGLLEKADMPAGIRFAAETPGEIALSILARMIHVKNNAKNEAPDLNP